MIITERFVMLNFPKTGSSFARDVLRRVHDYDAWGNRLLRRLPFASPSMLELRLPKIDGRLRSGRRDQHGTYRQIPRAHTHKTVFSVVRNPFERYVSLYLYGWWRTNLLPTTEERIRDAFPHFPDLDFREYYEMINLFFRENRLNGISPKIDLGLNTIQFIQFFFREPERTLKLIDEDYIETRRYLDDMADVVFLHQEDLNNELCDFLLHMGYAEADVGFIRNAERVNVTPRAGGQYRWEQLCPEDLQEDILNKDRLIFDIFPEYRCTFGAK